LSRPSNPKALEATLSRRFRVVETQVQLGGRTLTILHPASAEDLIDEKEFEQDERLPYWAELWPSSRILGEWVLRMTGNGRSLLELGCGAGVVATCAGLAGFHVVVSDYYEDALRFAQVNAWRNGAPTPKGLVLDWRNLAPNPGRYDVVIASEDATLADTHLNMALAATDGCHSIWPFRLGFQKTKDLLLNATSLTAREALNLGLVQYVVPAAELDAAVERYVHSLQQRSIRALQWTKMAVNFQMKQIVLPALENGLNLLEMSNFAPDHREAVAAFNEKRTPCFPVPPDRREPE